MVQISRKNVHFFEKAACIGKYDEMLEHGDSLQAKKICASCEIFDFCRSNNDKDERRVVFSALADMVVAGETRRERVSRRALVNRTEEDYNKLLEIYKKNKAFVYPFCMSCQKPKSKTKDKVLINGLCKECRAIAENMLSEQMFEHKETKESIVKYYNNNGLYGRPTHCFGCKRPFRLKTEKRTPNDGKVTKRRRGLCATCFKLIKDEVEVTNSIKAGNSTALPAAEIYKIYDKDYRQDVHGTCCKGCGKTMRHREESLQDFPNTVIGRNKGFCDSCERKRISYEKVMGL